MKHYQAVVVGGGIVGAGIFRDLSLHGINVLLIDKHDFSSQTSHKSSKMLHGGIRYLENLDFKLVFEALHEKNNWLKLTPHLTREVPLHLPVFNDSKRPLWMVKCGLFLYDLLSSFKNSPHLIKNKVKTLESIPILKSDGLKGCGVYFDGIMDDAKITLEVIFDALLYPNASAQNHTELIDVQIRDNKNILTLKNHLSGQIEKISCNQVVYSLGPYTDKFLSQFKIYNWSPVLLPSKGSHIWLSSKDLPLNSPIVITSKDERVIFVIPHDDLVLVGTTEVDYRGSYDNVKASTDEIQYLLKEVNNYFPSLNLSTNHIISTFSGIRPLISEGDSSRGKTSREHKIFQPLSNTYVIAGGKYTTFRVMGREISQEICHKNQKSYNQDLSLSKLKIQSRVLPFSWKVPTDLDFIYICENELPKTFEDLVKRRLSIPNRKTWDLKNPNLDFDIFFNSKITILSKYFPLSKEIIANFE